MLRLKEDATVAEKSGISHHHVDGGMVPAYGEVWYHPKTITNIFIFAKMEGKHPIMYDSTAEHAFIANNMADMYGIRMNYSNPQEHVPEAVRSIRVVKQRFRATYHRLPFKKMPKIIIKILEMECTKLPPDDYT